MANKVLIFALISTALACNFACIEDSSDLLSTCFRACRCDDSCLPGCYNSCVELGIQNGEEKVLAKCQCTLLDIADADEGNSDDVDEAEVALDEVDEDDSDEQDEDNDDEADRDDTDDQADRDDNDERTDDFDDESDEADEDDSDEKADLDDGDDEADEVDSDDEADEVNSDDEDDVDDAFVEPKDRSSDEPSDDREEPEDEENENPDIPSSSEHETSEDNDSPSVQPTDPVVPTDPVDPVAPTDPVQPADPADPTDPTQPADPEAPTDPTQPVDPVDPSDPTQPDTPVTPGNETDTPVLGGFGLTTPGDEAVQVLANSIKADVEAKLGASFSKFNVITYKEQVVAGTNYILKVEVDTGYIHVKANKALPYAGETVTVQGVEIGKTLDDPIVNFTEPVVVPVVPEANPTTPAQTPEQPSVPLTPVDIPTAPVAPVAPIAQDPVVPASPPAPIAQDPVVPVTPSQPSTPGLLGGFGSELPADENIQQIANSIKGDIESYLTQTFSKFNVVSYRQQVVAGMNYVMKIEVDNGFIHAKVYKSLPYANETVSLKWAEAGKALQDPIETAQAAPIAPPAPSPSTNPISDVPVTTEPTITESPTNTSTSEQTPTTNVVAGGASLPRAADESIQQLANSIKGQAESQLATTFSKFNVVSYTSQVVAGINYRIKIEVDNEFIHVQVFESLQAGDEATLLGVEQGKALGDPLVASTAVEAPKVSAETAQTTEQLTGADETVQAPANPTDSIEVVDAPADNVSGDTAHPTSESITETDTTQAPASSTDATEVIESPAEAAQDTSAPITATETAQAPADPIVVEEPVQAPADSIVPSETVVAEPSSPVTSKAPEAPSEQAAPTDQAVPITPVPAVEPVIPVEPWETHNENMAPPPPDFIDDLPIIPPTPEQVPAAIEEESPAPTDEAPFLATQALATTLLANVATNDSDCKCESFCVDNTSENCLSACREHMCALPPVSSNPGIWWSLAIELTLLILGITAIVIGLRWYKGRTDIADSSYKAYFDLNR